MTTHRTTHLFAALIVCTLFVKSNGALARNISYEPPTLSPLSFTQTLAKRIEANKGSNHSKLSIRFNTAETLERQQLCEENTDPTIDYYVGYIDPETGYLDTAHTTFSVSTFHSQYCPTRAEQDPNCTDKDPYVFYEDYETKAELELDESWRTYRVCCGGCSSALVIWTPTEDGTDPAHQYTKLQTREERAAEMSQAGDANVYTGRTQSGDNISIWDSEYFQQAASNTCTFGDNMEIEVSNVTVKSNEHTYCCDSATYEFTCDMDGTYTLTDISFENCAVSQNGSSC